MIGIRQLVELSNRRVEDVIALTPVEKSLGVLRNSLSEQSKTSRFAKRVTVGNYWGFDSLNGAFTLREPAGSRTHNQLIKSLREHRLLTSANVQIARCSGRVLAFLASAEAGERKRLPSGTTFWGSARRAWRQAAPPPAPQRVPLAWADQQRPPRRVAGGERFAAVHADAPAIETGNTDAGDAFDLSCREPCRFGSQPPLTEIGGRGARHPPASQQIKFIATRVRLPGCPCCRSRTAPSRRASRPCPPGSGPLRSCTCPCGPHRSSHLQHPEWLRWQSDMRRSM